MKTSCYVNSTIILVRFFLICVLFYFFNFRDNLLVGMSVLVPFYLFQLCLGEPKLDTSWSHCYNLYVILCAIITDRSDILSSWVRLGPYFLRFGKRWEVCSGSPRRLHSWPNSRTTPWGAGPLWGLDTLLCAPGAVSVSYWWVIEQDCPWAPGFWVIDQWQTKSVPRKTSLGGNRWRAGGCSPLINGLCSKFDVIPWKPLWHSKKHIFGLRPQFLAHSS